MSIIEKFLESYPAIDNKMLIQLKEETIRLGWTILPKLIDAVISGDYPKIEKIADLLKSSDNQNEREIGLLLILRQLIILSLTALDLNAIESSLTALSEISKLFDFLEENYEQAIRNSAIIIISYVLDYIKKNFSRLSKDTMNSLFKALLEISKFTKNEEIVISIQSLFNQT